MITRLSHFDLFSFRSEISRPSGATLLFVAGALGLAAEPIGWLVGTWFDPVYGSHGLPVFLLVLFLFGWSLGSPRWASDPRHRRHALGLFILTALVRLSGRVLAINTLGALVLALDVYALGLLAGLHTRQRPVSPGWLAFVFIFALPLERVIQRSIGYGLQHLSATGACFILDLGFASVDCQGVRILLDGQDVLVDLPCSGARGLLLLLLLFATLAALLRPIPGRAVFGLLLTLAAALAVNVLRIVLLAIGIAFPEQVGLSVMAQPWHDLIGLLCLAVGALPLIGWAIRTPSAPMTGDRVSASEVSASGSGVHARRHGRPTLAVAGLFALFAAGVAWAPAHPVDISHAIAAPTLPTHLAGVPGQSRPLSALETAYFTRYGGGAARRQYGEFSLLLVSTAAPLRHLHAPDECLTGLGHHVEYLGPDFSTIPTAIYRSTDPQGQVWRVAVTFYSSRGQVATSVAEAVWHWLLKPDVTWTMVERITPWSLPDAANRDWDRAVALALDLPLTTDSFPPAKETSS
ncbi:MAG: exosortase T [Gammaproteobacteria bacterium]|nr:exosortase T [Gammaproteobacteria bacterium]